MAAIEKTIQYKPGKILIRENQRSRRMYIIKSGKARVYKTYFGRKITLAILGQGEIFGELSFFDAEPRSASVETLTQLEAICIDGKEAQEQIKNLPHWVNTIFKSVFYRFREADQKLMVLQSMYEFQKRTSSSDTIAKVIHMELLRYNKMLEMVYNNKIKESNKSEIDFDQTFKDMEEVLGKQYLGLRTYFKSLAQNNLIDENKLDNENLILIDLDEIHRMNSYMAKEIESERYLLMSHSGLELLRSISGHINSTEVDSGNDNNIGSIKIETAKKKFPGPYRQGISELTKNEILTVSKNGSKLEFSINDVYSHFIFQTIIKSFDHVISHL